MSKNVLSTIVAFLLISAVGITNCYAQTSGTSPDVCYVGDQAILLTPPRFVIDGILEKYIWSGDGRYLLSVTQKINISPSAYAEALYNQKSPVTNITYKLNIWSSAAGSSVVNKEFNLPPYQNINIQWLKNSSIAVISIGNETAYPEFALSEIALFVIKGDEE